MYHDRRIGQSRTAVVVRYCNTKRFLALMCVIVLAATTLLSACAPVDGVLRRLGIAKGAGVDSGDVLSESNFVRVITSCLLMDDSEDIKAAYETIPSVQLDNMSLSTFTNYVQMLSGLTEGRGLLSSFKIISSEEAIPVQDAMVESIPNQEDLIRLSIPVELVFSDQSQTDPVFIYFQRAEDGMPYLSKSWVDQCLILFQYADHYFQAVNSQNINAIYSMISNSYLDASYSLSDKSIILKAREISRYYLSRVKSEPSEYRVVALNISRVEFNQPSVLTNDLEDYESRRVGFFMNSVGTVSVDEHIINTLSTRDYYLYDDYSRTIRIGDIATSGLFNSLFGSPKLTTIGRLLDASDSGDSESIRRIIVEYAEVSFVIVGKVLSDDNWEGTIYQIRISEQSEDFSLGNSIYVGMSRDEFMKLYPFADETDFYIENITDSQRYMLHADFSQDESDTLDSVTLELVD